MDVKYQVFKEHLPDIDPEDLGRIDFYSYEQIPYLEHYQEISCRMKSSVQDEKIDLELIDKYFRKIFYLSTKNYKVLLRYLSLRKASGLNATRFNCYRKYTLEELEELTNYIEWNKLVHNTEFNEKLYQEYFDQQIIKINRTTDENNKNSFLYELGKVFYNAPIEFIKKNLDFIEDKEDFIISVLSNNHDADNRIKEIYQILSRDRIKEILIKIICYICSCFAKIT